MNTPDTPTPLTVGQAFKAANLVVSSMEPSIAKKALLRVEELERELTAAKEESLEQARLLSMSGEREADLRGEIERLRRRVEAADDFAEVAEELITPEVCVWNPKQADKLDSATRAYRATEGKK